MKRSWMRRFFAPSVLAFTFVLGLRPPARTRMTQASALSAVAASVPLRRVHHKVRKRPRLDKARRAVASRKRAPPFRHAASEHVVQAA